MSRAVAEVPAGPRSRPVLPQRLPVPTRERFWLAATAVFVLLASLTHLPGFLRPLWSPDEAFLATQAGVLADGGVLYEDVVDRKPPLLPYLYMLTFRITGSSHLYSLRVLAVLAHVATALLLAAIARRRWGHRAAAAAVAIRSRVAGWPAPWAS